MCRRVLRLHRLRNLRFPLSGRNAGSSAPVTPTARYGSSTTRPVHSGRALSASRACTASSGSARTAGNGGRPAARTAAGTGADVTICDISLQRLTYLADVLPKNVKTLMSSEYNIRQELKHADLVIGSVLIPGAKAPKLVTRDMLKEMDPGTVMVAVAIDQGGCFESSRPSTHEDPVYYVDGMLHYCVANIPGAVPRTSTLALTNATLPYAIQLADKGWRRAAQENPELALGSTSSRARWSTARLPRRGGFPMSR